MCGGSYRRLPGSPNTAAGTLYFTATLHERRLLLSGLICFVIPCLKIFFFFVRGCLNLRLVWQELTLPRMMAGCDFCSGLGCKQRVVDQPFLLIHKTLKQRFPSSANLPNNLAGSDTNPSSQSGRSEPINLAISSHPPLLPSSPQSSQRSRNFYWVNL